MEVNPDVRHAARDLLGHYNMEGGYAAGSFRTALFNLWERADSSNRARLAMAFPAEAEAVDALSNHGESGLRRLAEASRV